VVIEPFVEVRRGRARPELDRALERCRETRAALLVPSLAAVGGDLAFVEALDGARVPLFAADAGAVRRPTLRLLHDIAATRRPLPPTAVATRCAPRAGAA
jgi:hypothetical protein